MYLFKFHFGETGVMHNILSASQVAACADKKSFTPSAIHVAGKILQHDYQANGFTWEKLEV